MNENATYQSVSISRRGDNIYLNSNPSTVDFIVEQAAAAGDVRARKMFGEYGLHCDGKFVGCVCDDQPYLKPTAAGRAYIGLVTLAPPYPGAKDYFFKGYF